MTDGYVKDRRVRSGPFRYALPAVSPQPINHEPQTHVWHQPPRRERVPFGLILLVASIFILMSAMSAAGVGLGLWVESDLIMPGVSVMGLDLSGRSTPVATTMLQDRWQQQRISVFAGKDSWHLSPSDLGMILNAPATIQRARRQGRSITSLELALRSGGRIELQPIWSFDRSEAAITIEEIASEFDRLPADATIAIEAGQATATPATTGRKVDVAATLDYLDHDPAQVLAAGTLPLTIVPLSARVEDATAVAAALNRFLSLSVVLQLFDPISGESSVVPVAPDVWSHWLTVRITDAQKGKYDWSLDDRLMQAYLIDLSGAFGPDRYLDIEQSAATVSETIASRSGWALMRIRHHERQHIVQPGETLASIGRQYGVPYPYIQRANTGLGDTLHVGHIVTIPSPDALLPLPVVADKRIVVSISQQRAWVYEDGQLKWEWSVSTGIDESPTAPGVFQIQSHETNAYAANWDLWMPHFMGVYQPVPDSDFMNGFHGFPTRGGATLLWTGDLGHRVTYGCILLSSENAEKLYSWAEEGVVVEIRL